MFTRVEKAGMNKSSLILANILALFLSTSLSGAFAQDAYPSMQKEEPVQKNICVENKKAGRGLFAHMSQWGCEQAEAPVSAIKTPLVDVESNKNKANFKIVYPKTNSTDPKIQSVDQIETGSIRPSAPVSKPRYGAQTLADIVDRSISDHPQILQQVERSNEVKFVVKSIEAGGKLQAETRIGAGHGSTGTKTTDTSLFGTSELAAAARVDGAISLKQLVYDFDGLKHDIIKTKKLLSSEEFKIIEKTEEISYRVIQSYLKIIEAREMLQASEQNVASLYKISRLVEENAKGGNATEADVKRVKARRLEGETQRTDLRSEMLAAMDQFRRLAKIEPGRLASPPNFSFLVPKKREIAIEIANNNHPRILALGAQNSAMDNELASQRAVGLPKIQAEIETNAKNYVGQAPRTEVDIRGMIALRYKFMDGGANKALMDQVHSRIIQGDLKYRFEKEEIEADIRQFYNSLESTRAKIYNLRSVVDANTKVTQLYIEQFLGGKRSLFELLDSQQNLYMSRRGVIQNQFEERRSIYGILRSTGQLTRNILSTERKALISASISKGQR